MPFGVTLDTSVARITLDHEILPLDIAQPAKHLEELAPVPEVAAFGQLSYGLRWM
jgi:hypothetical protein